MQSVRIVGLLPLHLEVGIHVSVGHKEPWALLDVAGVATQPRNLIVPATKSLMNVTLKRKCFQKINRV